MGAWDATIFGNDDAQDWIMMLEGTGDLSLIEQTVQTVLAAGGTYLLVDDGVFALVAAELIAGMLGRWSIHDRYTEPIKAWVKRVDLLPPEDLIQKAIKAVDRVMTAPSELLELWQEADDADFAAWKATVAELKKRLSTGN
jgi:hypothetical protein